MRDKVPVLVVARSTPVDAPRVLYRIMGPAFIESFDTATNRFAMMGASSLLLDHVSRYATIDQTALMEIRSRLILPFNIGGVRQSYVTDRDIRDRVFRKILLDEYRGQCVVCQSKFMLREEGKEPLIEAEAAHIISVSASGSDDPRNGLSFCKRHHWAFDTGLFTVTDGRTIKVSPSMARAERRRFDLEEYDREPLVGPAHEICRPHESALHWHQKRVFRQA
ncbi:MAG: HNH endonuclease [Candidatus Aminicenantales bacterium]